MKTIQILAHFFAAPLADMQGLTLKELEWLGSGSVVLVVALTITSLIKAVRDKGRVHATLGGQPIEVRTAVEYVPAPRFANFEKYVRRRDREIAEELHEMRLKAEERRAEAAEQSAALLEQIQERLEAHWKELNHERSANAAQLHQRIEATNLQMRQEMDAKFQIVRTELNDLPGRLISLLRDTGAIGKEPPVNDLNTPSQLYDLLFSYQRKWVLDRSQFKIGVMSRQAGKSFCTACEAVIDSMQDGGTKWVCLSAGERQALEWLEKCKEWVHSYKIAGTSTREDRPRREARLRQAEIRFPNHSRIVAIPANPSTARGYSANIVLDEFAYHENPDRIWAAMFPSLTNPMGGTFLARVRALCNGRGKKAATAIQRRMKIRVVSTFNGRENKFHQLWKNGRENGYEGHRVTIHDAVRDGLKVNLEELRSGLDDPVTWAQEYECEPCETSNTLLPYDLIALAESDEAGETCAADFWASGRTPLYCGIDFGRTTIPRSAGRSSRWATFSGRARSSPCRTCRRRSNSRICACA